jgi:hypothetical protein
MKDLIHRLEGADGPLDHGGVALLLAGIRGKTLRRFAIHRGDGGEDEMHLQFTDGTDSNISEYGWPDRSLDAAMALVVPEAWLSLSHRRDSETGARICVAALDFSREPYTAVGSAKTFPLALTIACLKAIESRRAAQSEDAT